MLAAKITQAADRIALARKLGVLTGAGVSAASGVPTFRGPSGLWKSWRPEDLATTEAFERDPALVWEWYQWRRNLIELNLEATAVSSSMDPSIQGQVEEVIDRIEGAMKPAHAGQDS